MDISQHSLLIIKYIENNGYNYKSIVAYKRIIELIAADALSFSNNCSITSIIESLEAKYRKELNEKIISKWSYKMLRRFLLILNDLSSGKELTWRTYPMKIPTGLNNFYTSKFNEFNNSYPSLIKYSCYLKEFFLYLQNSEIYNFIDAKSEDILNFIKITSNRLGSRSMEKIPYILKKAKSLFGDNFIPGLVLDLKLFVGKPGIRKIHMPYPQDELKELLNNIDTTEAIGLRDFAVIILGACLGLRSGDIANLKLTDFDWKAKELKFTQHKTGKTQILPLNEISSCAVVAYILEGRPDVNSDYVFLRDIAPYHHFKDGTSLSSILRNRMKKTGITRIKGDGKNFHGLRRSFATEMVKESTPISLVAELLGQSSTKSTSQYIRLDVESLRQCALDLDI
jgi:integrase